MPSFSLSADLSPILVAMARRPDWTICRMLLLQPPSHSPRSRCSISVNGRPLCPRIIVRRHLRLRCSCYYHCSAFRRRRCRVVQSTEFGRRRRRRLRSRIIIDQLCARKRRVRVAQGWTTPPPHYPSSSPTLRLYVYVCLQYALLAFFVNT